MKMSLWLKKTGIIMFWLILWQTAAVMIDNDIIFVGPIRVAVSLREQIAAPGFWYTIFYSFLRISAGFLASLLLGILLGSLSYRFSFFKDFLEPVITLMKTVPVASFIILALVWVGSRNLAILVSFLIVFPVIYINVLAGLNSTDKKMLEMAQVFQIHGWKKIYYIYQPALLPYLISSCQAALGMGWKSGIAAEVIGVPSHSIGEQLYMSKIYLDTSGLLSWTVVIILLSVISEKLFLRFLKCLARQ